jgi:hypothetical protein
VVHQQPRVSNTFTQEQANALASANIDLILYTVATIVKEADAGWIVGDASQYDPCIESNAARHVIIAFAVFGALMLMLVLDGCLVAFADFDALAWAMPAFFKDRRRGWLRSSGGVRTKGPGMSTLVRVAVQVLAQLAISAAIVLDITFDIILIRQLLPLTVGYVLLGLLCGSALAVGLATHLYLLASAGRRLSESAQDINRLASASPLVRLYLRLSQQSDVVVLLASLLLVPLLALLLDAVQIVVGTASVLLMAFKAFTASAGNQPQAPAGALDSSRYLAMRSFLTMALQSWPSLALTTWGYLALYKYDVGRLITPTIFLVSIGTSMSHTLIALWTVKELWLKQGSLTRALAELFDLGPEPRPAGASAVPSGSNQSSQASLPKQPPAGQPPTTAAPGTADDGSKASAASGPSVVEMLPAPGPPVERLPEP